MTEYPGLNPVYDEKHRARLIEQGQVFIFIYTLVHFLSLVILFVSSTEINSLFFRFHR